MSKFTARIEHLPSIAKFERKGEMKKKDKNILRMIALLAVGAYALSKARPTEVEAAEAEARAARTVAQTAAEAAEAKAKRVAQEYTSWGGKAIGNVTIGGTPATAGYQWYPARNGWMRPWDESSFIPRRQKPEWDIYI